MKNKIHHHLSTEERGREKFHPPRPRSRPPRAAQSYPLGAPLPASPRQYLFRPPRRPAGDRAVKRNTQAVRKARDKFSIPIVSAAFVRDSIAAGSRRDHAAYLLGSASKALPTSAAAAAAAPAASSPSDVPPPRAIAARAAASGSSVMELDDGSESDADEAGAGGGGKGGVGVASSRPREGSGIADAKSGFGDPDGDEDDQEDEDEDERPPARRAEVAAGGGRTPTDEAARRASLGPTLRESPARPVRRSLVAQAMALAGTKAGVRKFKLLENRLHRLRHLRWPRIETSIERACLVGSVAEFKRSVRAMRPEGGARGGGTGRGASAATTCAGACACCPRPQMKLKKRPPASACSPCEY